MERRAEGTVLGRRGSDLGVCRTWSVEAKIGPSEDSVRRAGHSKVVACLAGHHHDDGYEERRGVHYFRVNSASYLWVGDPYGRMAHYDRSLFTFVTVTEGEITLEARDAEWVPPTPAERGVPEAQHFVPRILGRKVSLAPR